MRELTSHKVNGVNDGLTITVRDEPGVGGANHEYMIQWSENDNLRAIPDCGVLLSFQNGPIREAGVNGITHEALLAILIDRLEGFQRGKFACGSNELALVELRRAQTTLLDRTRERSARGVEGTHTV